MGSVAGFGAGFGVLRATVDGEDDDLLSTVSKAGVNAGINYGIGKMVQAGVGHLEDNGMTVEDVVEKFEDVFKKKHVGDVETPEIKKTKLRQEREAFVRAGKQGRRVMQAWKGGIILTGVLAAADLLSSMHDNTEAKHLDYKQEKAMEKREKKQKEREQKEAYGYLQDGEIAFELFDARSGHHKMGNAKFM